MKKIICLTVLFAFLYECPAQVSGNVNYINGIRYAENSIEVRFPPGKALLVNVSGMANIKADSCVAIFSVVQTGKTAEEVNNLMDGRINSALAQIKQKAGIRTYVDMISFVPVYEYEADKKVFSKRTYNELPAGFELKKNIHIKYAKPDDLHEIITILSAGEIYDMVRVDYFSNSMEAVKKELMTKARTAMQEKMKNYQLLMGTKLDTLDKQLADGFRAMLPVEMYRSYQAYNNSAVSNTKGKYVNQAEKSTTQYYQPVVDKEFDFVINPVVFEPVIQVMYEVKMHISLEKEKPAQAVKEYILVTPSGDLKSLPAAVVRQ